MGEINKPKRNSSSSLSGSPTKSNHVGIASSVQESELDSPSRESFQFSEPIESGDPAPIHPTESQESSVQLHFVRQERAREVAQEAQRKYMHADMLLWLALPL